MGYPFAPETLGVGAITRRLGAERTPSGRARTITWQLAYLRDLIACCGFPQPLPLRKGTGITYDVKPASQWPARAVDRWFEDRMPPGADAIDPAAERAAIDAMDDAAAGIGARMRDRVLHVVRAA